MTTQTETSADRRAQKIELLRRVIELEQPSRYGDAVGQAQRQLILAADILDWVYSTDDRPSKMFSQHVAGLLGDNFSYRRRKELRERDPVVLRIGPATENMIEAIDALRESGNIGVLNPYLPLGDLQADAFRPFERLQPILEGLGAPPNAYAVALLINMRQYMNASIRDLGSTLVRRVARMITEGPADFSMLGARELLTTFVNRSSVSELPEFEGDVELPKTGLAHAVGIAHYIEFVINDLLGAQFPGGADLEAAKDGWRAVEFMKADPRERMLVTKLQRHLISALISGDLKRFGAHMKKIAAAAPTVLNEVALLHYRLSPDEVDAVLASIPQGSPLEPLASSRIRRNTTLAERELQIRQREIDAEQVLKTYENAVLVDWVDPSKLAWIVRVDPEAEFGTKQRTAQASPHWRVIDLEVSQIGSEFVVKATGYQQGFPMRKSSEMLKLLDRWTDPNRRRWDEYGPSISVVDREPKKLSEFLDSPDFRLYQALAGGQLGLEGPSIK